MPTIEHLFFQYDHQHIVFEDFSFSFPSGSVTAIIGPSGCGKTTLLQLLAGLLKPTKGRIFIGSDKLSYIFQEPRLFPWMTALENVSTVANTKDHSKELLFSLDLKETAFDQYPSELSGGMKQRIAIARALAWKPDIILMDEPFHGLDAETKHKTANVLFSYLKGKTGILVTHDEADLNYCDHILDLSLIGKK